MKKILHTLIILTCSISLWGQKHETEVQDTLDPAYSTAYKTIKREVGMTRIDIKEAVMVSSPMGEGDVIKFIQTLPGISIGGEGTSAIYVRGGNIGNNTITLDDVPLYGYGHLLGLTTAFSPDIVGNMDFYVGGFEGESNNLLASHIKVTSKDGNFTRYTGNGSISNFIVSASSSGPIVKNKLSYLVAGRISPFGLEYQAFSSILKESPLLFEQFNASVYDVFGKLTYRISDKIDLRGSIFHSKDGYMYGEPKSLDNLAWDNLTGNLNLEYRINEKWMFRSVASYNDYGSLQEQEKELNGSQNSLSIKSSIYEIMIREVAQYNIAPGMSLKFGITGKFNRFNPGSSKYYEGSDLEKGDSIPYSDKISNTFLGTPFIQYELAKENKYRFMLAARYNIFVNSDKKYSFQTLIHNPEVSAIANYSFFPWLGAEASFDYISQYFHTLEGIPLGWSLDMIIPSSDDYKPETSIQYYLGLFSNIGQHHRISVGAYFKKMKNLVYFADATNFFSASAPNWQDNIKTGDGFGKGIEILYEKSGNVLTYRIAYTLSESRRKFPTINRGNSFRAKYDRPHILNANVNYKIIDHEEFKLSANSLFVFQSGHLESVRSAVFPGILPGWGEEIPLDYYSSPNNFRMPNYIRWDIGCNMNFIRKKTRHTLNVGIYNLLNRFNPFSLYYNSELLEWQMMALFPIMPNFYYKIEF